MKKNYLLFVLLTIHSITQAQKLFRFQAQKGYYGFMGADTSVIIAPKYNEVKDFSEGYAAVNIGITHGWDPEGIVEYVQNHGKWGFIDSTGKEIVPLKYDYAESFCNGLALVSINYKTGFINSTGKEAVPLKYDYAGKCFYNGLAKVKIFDKWGYINADGREVIPLIFYEASDFDEGLAYVNLNGRFGYIDTAGHTTGKKFFHLIYEDNEGTTKYFFSEGLAAVKQNGKWGYIDKTGKEIIPFIYDYATYFYDGEAVVIKNGKIGFINKAGDFAPDFPK